MARYRVSYKLSSEEADIFLDFCVKLELPPDRVAKQALFLAMQESLRRANVMLGLRPGASDTDEESMRRVNQLMSEGIAADELEKQGSMATRPANQLNIGANDEHEIEGDTRDDTQEARSSTSADSEAPPISADLAAD